MLYLIRGYRGNHKKIYLYIRYRKILHKNNRMLHPDQIYQIFLFTYNLWMIYWSWGELPSWVQYLLQIKVRIRPYTDGNMAVRNHLSMVNVSIFHFWFLYFILNSECNNDILFISFSIIVIIKNYYIIEFGKSYFYYEF